MRAAAALAYVQQAFDALRNAGMRLEARHKLGQIVEAQAPPADLRQWLIVCDDAEAVIKHAKAVLRALLAEAEQQPATGEADEPSSSTGALKGAPGHAPSVGKS
jgi:hypothetical protein